MRLVFKRKKGQSVRIGEVLVTVTDTARGHITLVVDAPAEIAVWRAELGDFDPRKRPDVKTDEKELP